MQELTPEGRHALHDIARLHGVSADAAMTLLRAVAAGGGTMAQFSHPELGGMGQWSAGGMIMLGDMFNHGLKQRVDALCSDLAAMLREKRVFVLPPHDDGMSGGIGGGGQWWPAGLGAPAATGAQNDLRYAYFPASRRLIVQQGGQVRLYDTGDHQIGGVSQQQGGGQSLAFTSQRGPVRLADLPRADAAEPAAPVAPAQASAPHVAADDTGARIQRIADPPPAEAAEGTPPIVSTRLPASPQAAGDPLALIERLAELHQRGILSDEEYSMKKTELLRRL